MAPSKTDFFGWMARIYYIAAGLYYVAHWITLLGVIVPVSVFGVILFRGARAPYYAGASAFLGLTLFSLGVFLLVRGTASRFAGLNSGLEFTRAEYTYEIPEDPRDVYRHTASLEVRAVADNVRHCDFKFGWTGSGEARFRVPEGFTLWARRLELFDVAEVIFPRALAKGDKAAFVVTLELRDEEQIAGQFLSKVVHEYFRNGFEHRVILPPRLRDRHVTAAVYPAGLGEVPIKPRREVSCDPVTGEVRQSVPRPRFGFRYSLEWGPASQPLHALRGQQELILPPRQASLRAADRAG